MLMINLHILKMELGPFKNYSYIGIDSASGKAFAVDPSWRIEKVTDILDAHGAVLSAILLTHSHIDHTNLVEKLLKIYNDAIIYMSEDEITNYHFECKMLQPVHDMEIINIGCFNVKCIQTPGHTKGSMCYLCGQWLFSGDTVFTEGCGICSGYAAAEQMFYSIQKIKSEVPEDVRVYPGHSYGRKPGETISMLNRDNIYFQLDDKDSFIEFRMRKNQKGLFAFKYPDDQ